MKGFYFGIYPIVFVCVHSQNILHVSYMSKVASCVLDIAVLLSKLSEKYLILPYIPRNRTYLETFEQQIDLEPNKQSKVCHFERLLSWSRKTQTSHTPHHTHRPFVHYAHPCRSPTPDPSANREGQQQHRYYQNMIPRHSLQKV